MHFVKKRHSAKTAKTQAKQAYCALLDSLTHPVKMQARQALKPSSQPCPVATNQSTAIMQVCQKSLDDTYLLVQVKLQWDSDDEACNVCGDAEQVEG